MKIDEYTIIMTGVRHLWILSVCGRAMTSPVKRGLQQVTVQTHTHTHTRAEHEDYLITERPQPVPAA